MKHANTGLLEGMSLRDDRTKHKRGSSKLIPYSLQTRLIASLLPYYASITTRKLPRFFATRQAVVVPERSNSKSRMVGPTRKL